MGLEATARRGEWRTLARGKSRGTRVRAPRTRLLLLLLAILVVGGAAHASGSGPVFTRIPDAGPAVEDSVVAGAGAFADYDGDGDLDLATGFETTHIYRNEGGTFVEILTGDAVTNDPLVTYGTCVWGDFDNDGDPDFYRGLVNAVDGMGNDAGPRQDRLYRNEGPPDFELVHVPIPGDSTRMNSASWVDADLDGDLDVYVAGVNDGDLFLRNDGSGQFASLTGLPIFTTVSAPGVHETWVDVDLDGDQDLYVVNIGQPNELYRNRAVEDGALSFETWNGTPLTNEGFVFDVAGVFGDYDNDGDFDCFVPVTGGPPDQLYRNEGGGAFVRILSGDPVSIGNQAASGAWGDADNDGDLDLFVPQVAIGAVPSFYYRNDGAGVLSRVTTGLGDLLSPIPGVSAAQWGDVDGDGDLDVFVATLRNPNNASGPATPNVLLRNEGTSGHWLGVHCIGTISNRDAIGARVEVTATIGGESVTQTRYVSGSGTAALFQPPRRQHVGLGDATSADLVRITWPSGNVQTLNDVPADGVIDVVEPSTVDVAEALAPAVLTVWHAPNPSRGGATFRVHAVPDARVVIDLFDGSGRRVRRVSGSGELRWDGRDAEGRSVAPGVYLYRVHADGVAESATGRLVVTR